MSPTERTRLLQKRQKLAALAERGVDGERDNARCMLAAFDERHPELRPKPATQFHGGVGPTIRVTVNGVERDMTMDELRYGITVVFNIFFRR